MSIQRYDHVLEDHDNRSYMKEYEEGDFVKHADHLAEKASDLKKNSNMAALLHEALDSLTKHSVSGALAIREKWTFKEPTYLDELEKKDAEIEDISDRYHDLISRNCMLDGENRILKAEIERYQKALEEGK